MRIGSPFPHKKARIEIIPLIDIMFFLLASFMMASLTMIRMQSIKMELPTSTIATKDTRKDIINIAVDKVGDMTIDKQPVNLVQLHELLAKAYKDNTNTQVYITGDPDATHEMVIRVLDTVRRERIQKVSFALSPAPIAKQ